MILDILSPSDPPTLETLPSIIRQCKTNEVMEIIMKDLSMDDDVKPHNKSGAGNRDFTRITETVSGKKKGKSPMGDEKKPKKLKSEPSENASNKGLAVNKNHEIRRQKVLRQTITQDLNRKGGTLKELPQRKTNRQLTAKESLTGLLHRIREKCFLSLET